MFKLKKRTESRKEIVEDIPKCHDECDFKSSDQDEYDDKKDYDYEKCKSSDDKNFRNSDENDNDDNEEEDNNNDNESNQEEEENVDNDEENSNDEENEDLENDYDFNDEASNDNDDDDESSNHDDDVDDDDEANNDDDGNDDDENNEYDDSDKSGDSKPHKKSHNSTNKSSSVVHTNYSCSNERNNKNFSKKYKDHKSGNNNLKSPKSYTPGNGYHSKQYNGSNYKNSKSSYNSKNSSKSPKSCYDKKAPQLSAPKSSSSGSYSKYGNDSKSTSSKTTEVIYVVKKVIIQDDGHHQPNYPSKGRHNKNSSSNSNNSNNYNKSKHRHDSKHHRSDCNKLDPYDRIYSKVDLSSDVIADISEDKGRKVIAAQTCGIIQAGFYYYKKKNGTCEKVNIADLIKKCVDGTRVYKPDFFTKTDRLTRFTPGEMCKIEIVSGTSYGVARKILKEDDQKNVCVLNFASATKPGGGFIGGKNAQEEALSRQSALYASLYKKPEMYKAHEANHNHHYYMDYLIYSPKVPVFRDDNDELLLRKNEMFTTSVITSAAPFLREIKSTTPNFEEKYRNYYEQTILDRCRKIIMLAIYKKTDVLVLGAYGCGVFENEPNVVFGAFKTVLVDEGYGNYFELVSFPISPNSNKGKVFKKVFKDYLS